MKILDLTGHNFGKLTALETCGVSAGVVKSKLWRCICQCGKEKVTTSTNLVSGKTKSCGCLMAEVRAKRRGVPHPSSTTHGATTQNKRTPEYTSWISMRQRCRDPNHSCYKNYGAKGISVCDQWRSSFETFLRDMGPRPTPKHSIDRVDPFGNYEPSNCRWASFEQQQNNRANCSYVEVSGVRMTVTELSRKSGIPKSTLQNRLNAMNGNFSAEVLLRPHRARKPAGL